MNSSWVAPAVSVALDVSQDLRRSVRARSAWTALAPLVFAGKLGVPLRVRVTMVHCPGFWGPLIISDTPAPDARLRFMTRATGADQNRQSQELTIFHDVAKALTSSLDLDSILQTIMEKMAEYFRPDTWSLLMVDDEREELYFAIAVGECLRGLEEHPAESG